MDALTATYRPGKEAQSYYNINIFKFDSGHERGGNGINRRGQITGSQEINNCMSHLVGA